MFALFALFMYTPLLNYQSFHGIYNGKCHLRYFFFLSMKLILDVINNTIHDMHQILNNNNIEISLNTTKQNLLELEYFNFLNLNFDITIKYDYFH